MHGELQPDPTLNALLSRVEEFIIKYTVLPDDHSYSAVTLWAAHTWVVDCFDVTPRLIMDSAEPESGKTRVLDLLKLLSHNPMFTFNVSSSVLFHSISHHDLPPTILQDEADAVFRKGTNKSEDIRGLFNAGYKRGSTVMRMNGTEIESFDVFAPVALAGIAGHMPDTITTRAITINMKKRRASDEIGDFRERHAKAEAIPMKRGFEAWAFDAPAGYKQTLSHHIPVLPDGVRDRAAEIWEPLLTIADAAGTTWGQRAREACEHFVVHKKALRPVSPGVQLLRDLYAVFDGRPQMHTKDILSALYDLEEGGEWDSYQRGGALTARQLAELLSRYGVQRKTLKVRGVAGKGYAVQGESGLGQAWDRYLQ
ncbi:DUF3631 domain-containing protein [Nocardia goodfellowii]